MCAWLQISDTISVFINNRSFRLAQMYPLINSDYLKPDNKTTDCIRVDGRLILVDIREVSWLKSKATFWVFLRVFRFLSNKAKTTLWSLTQVVFLVRLYKTVYIHYNHTIHFPHLLVQPSSKNGNAFLSHMSLRVCRVVKMYIMQHVADTVRFTAVNACPAGPQSHKPWSLWALSWLRSVRRRCFHHECEQWWMNPIRQ